MSPTRPSFRLDTTRTTVLLHFYYTPLVSHFYNISTTFLLPAPGSQFLQHFYDISTPPGTTNKSKKLSACLPTCLPACLRVVRLSLFGGLFEIVFFDLFVVPGV